MDELTLVREALDDVVAGLTPRPPSRADIDAGLRRVRRRRRFARAGTTVGSLGAVAASVAVLQVGLVSLPAWAPAVPISAGPSALSEQSTKGSLADDAAFLASLREKVATIDNTESGGERWRAPSADRVDVLYAGDVGGYRVALVETPLRWGAVEARQQIWYLGVRGAPADELLEGQSNGPQEVAASAVGRDSLPPEVDVEGAVGVVVGATTEPVELLGPVRVSADGRVTWPTTRLTPSEPGVWEVTLAEDAARAFVRVGDMYPVPVGDVGASSPSAAERDALLAGVRPAVRTGAPDDARLAESVSVAQYSSGLAVAGSTRRLVWSGELTGSAFDVVEVTAPSGGRVVVAVMGSTDAAEPGARPVAVTSVATDSEPAVAWLFGGGTVSVPGPTVVGLVGPRDAVAARVTAPDGTTSDVRLTEGVGAGAGPAAASVAFVGADGEVLARAPVTRPGAGTALYPPELLAPGR